MDTIHTLNDNSGIISEPGKVRVIMRDGEPWFVASDVAKALGYADPSRAVIEHCKKTNKITHIGESPNRPPLNFNIIPEQDVYRLIMRSNLPGAERFQDWVCGEVLPSIRKRGVYVPQTAPQIAMPNFADPAAAARAGFNYCPCNHMKRLKGSESLPLTKSPRGMNIIPESDDDEKARVGNSDTLNDNKGIISASGCGSQHHQ